MARWVDGVVVVSKAGESTREAGQKAVELLGKVGARIIGVVVWGLDETKNRPGYGYGYYTGGYYYNRSEYGTATPAKSRRGCRPNRSELGAGIGGPRIARVVGRILTACLSSWL